MTPKSVKKLNGRLLKDATEYLNYVKQLEIIRLTMFKLGPAIDVEKQDFLHEITPIVEDANIVVKEVLSATTALSQLPSSAARHKRRACVSRLDTVLQERAMHIAEIFSAIMKAGTLMMDNPEVEETTDEG